MRKIEKKNSEQFAAVCQELLQSGAQVRFRAEGESMRPNILDGDVVVLTSSSAQESEAGEVALTRGKDGLRLHRVTSKDAEKGTIVTRGDSGQECDPETSSVVGKVVSIERAGKKKRMTGSGVRLIHDARGLAHKIKLGSSRRLKKVSASLAVIGTVLFAVLLLGASPAAGQTADLSVTQTAAPTTVAPGGTYILSDAIRNTSLLRASTTPSITQAIPANTTYQSFVAPGVAWTCSATPVGAPTVVTCNDSANLAANTTVTLTVTVKANTGLAGQTALTGTATVSSSNNTNAGNDTSTATVTVIVADLAVSLTPSSATVIPSTNYSYTAVVTNNGPSTAAAPSVAIGIPANTVYQSITASAGWTCAVAGATATCTDGSALVAAGTGTFTLTVNPNAGLALGTILSNSATVTSASTDSNSANNTAAATVTVAFPDLALTQTAAPLVVASGSTITYTETVTNAGNASASDVVLYQQTPLNTTFTSATAPLGWTCVKPAVGGTGQIVCTDGAAMGAAATANFTIVVTVLPAATAGTTIVNSADVTSSTFDGNGANNTTTTTVLVEKTGQADLLVTMSAAPAPVFIYSTLTYKMQILNQGLASATAVSLADTIPAATTFVSASSTQGTCTQVAATVCTIGAIASGSTVTVTIVVTTQGSGTTLTNTATATTTATDPNALNNSATALTVVQPLVCASPGRDGAGGTLTGIVNTYYPPSAVGTLAAGAKIATLGVAVGSTTPIAAGDLLIVIQMQDAATNSTNTSSYGDGTAGDPAMGSTGTNSSGLYEFVTATNAVPVGGGTLNFIGTGATSGLLNTYASAAATATLGKKTYQIIRVPQYTSATLSAGLVPLAWNGVTGGVLALDVASQLTLGGTVSLDGTGFRGGAGRTLAGGTGAATDYVTLSSTGFGGSKAEGIAGTPRYLANSAITAVIDTAVEGMPGGSYLRGAPASAGGGGTDGNPAANDQNTGGGGGGNGGTGGYGGYAWSSITINGGTGGAPYPASTSTLFMGGGGGAGTTNNGTADPNTNTTGINSSGSAGGGIAIIHVGSVTGTGTISANGQPALNVLNDGGGGAGAGGTILFLANSGTLSGLTARANGGAGGDTWASQPPTVPFPGNRHGPGGGGAGGAVLLSDSSATVSVAGGLNGTTTTASDAYGAIPGTVGTSGIGIIISETPGTQPGAECATADLSVTNVGTPNPVSPGNNITYTQAVTNSGPIDAANAVFSEAVPANTTFQSISAPAGWTCVTPAVNGTGNISCTNPLVANGAVGSFTVVVKVNAATTFGTQIVDVVSVTAGTTDADLTDNTAAAFTIVGSPTSAYLTLTKTAAANSVVAGGNITYTLVAHNNGPAAAIAANISDAIPANTTFVSMTTPGWTCSLPAVGGTGNISCTLATFANGGTATFTLVVKVTVGTANGTLITNSASVNATTPNPNPNAATASATVIVAAATQADLVVATSDSPDPVLSGNNITYTQSVTNNGPAAAATLVFTDVIPAGTTFVSMATPAGWICSTPAVGSAGTVSCTAVSLAAGASSNFPLVLKVATTTVPGTVITNSPGVTTATSDPNSANNSASTTTVVASPTQADLAIVKTASPEPVNQGTNITYQLRVTNSGPAVAQGVTVSDPLPAQVTYTSVFTTQGTCTQSAGTVSCTLGSISVGATVLVTINANAATFSSATLASNTATVSSTTGDPSSANNSSTAISTIQSPTAVQLASFRAIARSQGGVTLEWKTREEIRNLGFHVYREDASGRHRLNPSIIAGGALLVRGGRPQHSAKTYQWLDPQSSAGATYWLEDVDLNGTRTTHGPARAEAAATAGNNSADESHFANALLLSHLNRSITQTMPQSTRVVATPRITLPEVLPGEYRVSLDSDVAAKIAVRHEGWYRVSRAQLTAAGLGSNFDLRNLQLYAEGIEQPLLIRGDQTGRLNINYWVEFYGVGIDTPYSDARMYWLVRGSRPGKRIQFIAGNTSSTVESQSFPFTVVHEDRTTYFATLLNGEDKDNFFGAAVTTEPVDQELNIVNSDSVSGLPVTLDITLQGGTEAQVHRVSVAFNGSALGEMNLSGLANVTQSFPVDASMLHDGVSTVTLAALEGDNDVSLVQSIQLHYAHRYVADTNWLRAEAAAGSAVHIAGFTNAQIRVFDISDPRAIVQLNGSVRLEGSTYGVSVPLNNPGPAQRTLLAFTDEQSSAPDAITPHSPSTLNTGHSTPDIVVISHPDFLANLAPLVTLRESQGYDVEVATTDQIFDAYNYGERSPVAIRDYLRHLATQRRTKPQALLLVGDASLDPRNYLGFGDLDLVPTRMIETDAFKTASDDWFTDFNQTGFATIATGRLPVRTASDAVLVVAKIINYERGSYNGSWNRQALVIADQNVGADFTSEAQFANSSLPSTLSSSQILADGRDTEAVRQQIISSINSGALLVNYTGHGSTEQWSFANIFDNDAAAALTNGQRLPVFLLMDCLNGFFQDVYSQSLAESLLLAPNGGAVAVWASSGFTNSPPQSAMNQAFLNALKSNPAITVGKAAMAAKLTVNDKDVRRTWVLFGDPSMKLQFGSAPAAEKPASGSASSPAPAKPIKQITCTRCDKPL